MKKLFSFAAGSLLPALLLSLLLLSLAARAQQRVVPAPNLPADSLTGRIRVVGVVAVPGVAAAELQARAREWLALTFEDVRAVVQLDDPARGVLIGRAYDAMLVKNKPQDVGGDLVRITFTFRLDFRDGRYRYELRDFGRGPGLSDGTTVSDLNTLVYRAANWQRAGQSTLATSPRQELLQPLLLLGPDDYDVVRRYGKREWASLAAALNQRLDALLDSWHQYAAAPARQW